MALRRTDAASLTQVLGHLHAVADARGGCPSPAELGRLVFCGGRLALLALGGPAHHVTTLGGGYVRVAQPAN